MRPWSDGLPRKEFGPSGHDPRTLDHDVFDIGRCIGLEQSNVENGHAPTQRRPVHVRTTPRTHAPRPLRMITRGGLCTYMYTYMYVVVIHRYTVHVCFTKRKKKPKKSKKTMDRNKW